MEQKIISCPFCNREINPRGIGSHIYKCDKKIGVSKEEVYFEYLKILFPKICDKSFLSQCYERDMKSLPDIKKDFGIAFRGIVFLLKYFGIKLRSAEESAKLISKSKYRETCLKKFGKINALSKGTESYTKRNKTVKERYGVDNVFQTKGVIDKIQDDNTYLNLYGKTRHQVLSIRGKKVWEAKTDDEKNKWLYSSILSEKGITNCTKGRTGYIVSKLEGRVQESLNEIGITYTKQFTIKTSRRNRKVYDFLVDELKTIIEVNGDYWHANPKIYKEGDIIHYVYGYTPVIDIWAKDEKKKKIALDKGYKIVYIWELEMKDRTDEELLELVKERMKE